MIKLGLEKQMIAIETSSKKYIDKLWKEKLQKIKN